MSEEMPSKQLKLLIIGLDGATFDVIKPMVDRDELPNLAGLMKKGTCSYLESTIPPFSAPAWTSIMTGMNPGKHGIFGFINYNPLSYTHLDSGLVNAKSLVGHTLFDILSRAGYRLGVITVPLTYPAWEINGYMVAGEPCPDSDKHLASPVDFAVELPRRYAFRSTFWSKPNDEIITGLYDMDKSRTELAIQLIQEKEVDALMVVLGSTDRAQHNFWRYYDPVHEARLGLPREADYSHVIPETYRLADQAVGNIISHANENTLVLIISDHGAGASATKVFNSNAWLKQLGLLNIKKNRDALAGGARKFLVAARQSLGKRVELFLRGILPAGIWRQGRALIRNVAQIDWLSTRAYRFPMYPPAEGIVINVAGRQAQGIVQPGDEYEQLREDLMVIAKQIVDPETGKPVVKSVYKREQIYSGRHIERAPDIILILEDDYTGGTNINLPIITVVDPASLFKVNGEHRMHGVLMAYGPAIRDNTWINNARLIDIAPTILYALDHSIPSEMDGIVLGDLFHPDYLETHPIQNAQPTTVDAIQGPDTTYSAEEREQIEKQLKRLGYL